MLDSIQIRSAYNYNTKNPTSRISKFLKPTTITTTLFLIIIIGDVKNLWLYIQTSFSKNY